MKNGARISLSVHRMASPAILHFIGEFVEIVAEMPVDVFGEYDGGESVCRGKPEVIIHGKEGVGVVGMEVEQVFRGQQTVKFSRQDRPPRARRRPNSGKIPCRL